MRPPAASAFLRPPCERWSARALVGRAASCSPGHQPGLGLSRLPQLSASRAFRPYRIKLAKVLAVWHAPCRLSVAPAFCRRRCRSGIALSPLLPCHRAFASSALLTSSNVSPLTRPSPPASNRGCVNSVEDKGQAGTLSAADSGARSGRWQAEAADAVAEMLGGPTTSVLVEISVQCKGLPNKDVLR